MSVFCQKKKLAVRDCDDSGPRVTTFAQFVCTSEQTQCMLSPLSSTHNEKIVTVHQDVGLQTFMEEVARRSHTSGKPSRLPNLGIMFSPTLGSIQRSIHRLSQFPTHTWLLYLGVLVRQTDVDVANCIGVEVGSTHICDGDQERVLNLKDVFLTRNTK